MPDEAIEALEVLLMQAERHIRHVLLEQKEDQLVPLFAMAKRGEMILCPTPWRDDDEKRLMVEAVRQEMHREGVKAYVFMSEAWSAAQPEGWKPGDAEGPLPEDRPDRQEIVFAVACDKERILHRVWRIVRGEAGTIVKLEREKDLDGLTGRMAGLLR
jgi:hypothetical protein